MCKIPMNFSKSSYFRWQQSMLISQNVTHRIMYVVSKEKKYIYKVKEFILSKEALTALHIVIIYLQKQENLNSRKTAQCNLDSLAIEQFWSQKLDAEGSSRGRTSTALASREALKPPFLGILKHQRSYWTTRPENGREGANLWMVLARPFIHNTGQQAKAALHFPQYSAQYLRYDFKKLFHFKGFIWSPTRANEEFVFPPNWTDTQVLMVVIHRMWFPSSDTCSSVVLAQVTLLSLPGTHIFFQRLNTSD